MNQHSLGLNATGIFRAVVALLMGLTLWACENSTSDQTQTQQVAWVQYDPPNRGAPGESSDSGSRPLCKKPSMPFTSLSPSTNWGETLQAYPTFWLYLPYQASTVRFILRDEPTQRELYRTNFVVSKGDGAARFQMPNTAPSLEVDRLYNWQFDFICDAENRSRFRVRGLVVRRSPSEALSTQLKNALPRERVTLLAKEGFWFDSLTELADLRQANAQDSEIKAGWEALLNHPQVKLQAFVDKPLLDCCSPESKP